MKTIRTFTNVGEAGFFQSLLESAGIDATLQHEGSATAVPLGIVSIQLQVSEDSVADAERIMSEHPVRFTSNENRPRLGFWKGSVYGLIAFAVMLILITISGGSWKVTGLGLFLVFVVSGLVGANYPLAHSRPANG